MMRSTYDVRKGTNYQQQPTYRSSSALTHNTSVAASNTAAGVSEARRKKYVTVPPTGAQSHTTATGGRHDSPVHNTLYEAHTASSMKKVHGGTSPTKYHGGPISIHVNPNSAHMKPQVAFGTKIPEAGSQSAVPGGQAQSYHVNKMELEAAKTELLSPHQKHPLGTIHRQVEDHIHQTSKDQNSSDFISTFVGEASVHLGFRIIESNPSISNANISGEKLKVYQPVKGNHSAPPNISSSSYISHSEVDQCLYYGPKACYADAVFPANCNNEEMGNCIIPSVLFSAMNGRPYVLAAYGASRSGKSSTLFGKGGLFQSYVMQLLHELHRLHLSQLWTVRVSILRIVGEQVTDALACSSNQQNFSNDMPKLSSMVIENVRSLETIVENLPTSFTDAENSPSNTEMSEEAKHVVVSVTVTPSIAHEGLSHLMKPLGTVHFVECNDKLWLLPASQSQNIHRLSVLKTGGVSLLNVLAALLRRSSNANAGCGNGPQHNTSSSSLAASSIYIPYKDNTLTQMLQEELEHGQCWLLLHLDGSVAPSAPCQSTLDVAGRLVKEKYPQGPPLPDYRDIAFKEHEKLVCVRQEFESAYIKWEAERVALMNEKFILQKTYDACSARLESILASQAVAGSSNFGVGSPSSLRSGGQREASHLEEVLNTKDGGRSVASLHHQITRDHEEMKSLKKLLTSVQAENAELRKMMTGKKAGNASPSGKPPRSEEEMWSEDTKEALQSIKKMLDVLSKKSVVELYSGGGGPSHEKQTKYSSLTTTMQNCEACILQLLHQCCEREKAYESAIQRSIVHESMGAKSNEVSNISSSPIQEQRSVRLKEELEMAPLLSWQSWRALLQEMKETTMSTRPLGSVGLRPLERTMLSEASLFALSDSSTEFYRYWMHGSAFYLGYSTHSNSLASPANDVQTAISPQGRQDMESPPSRLTRVLEDY